MGINNYSKCLMFFFYIFCILQTIVKSDRDDDERKVYIVYMGELPKDNSRAVMDDHHNLLTEAIGNFSEEMARETKIYSYWRSFNGFAAKLLLDEAEKLSENEKVVSVFPSRKHKLLTTRSWDFLGMPINVTRNEGVESNVIIGLLDSGIYLPSKSFSDAGFGPPPKKWKGRCDTSHNFPRCNNKVIGARVFGHYPSDHNSPGDYTGHGTHTSSIAAGVPVRNASLLGFGEGTARGGVPLARIAMYKVCDSYGCRDDDILAGFDAAIADGIDVLSISIGKPTEPVSGYYLQDSIAIGNYHAAMNGILVCATAGNQGNVYPAEVISNTAPWIETVAASTIDRVFYAQVELGNGKTFHANAISLYDTERMYPLVGIMKTYRNGSCNLGSVSEDEIRGKIVYCIGVIDYGVIPQLDGVIAGALMISYTDPDTPDVTTMSVATVTSDFGNLIETYINSTRNPMARIYKSTEERAGSRAPMVASFSSRGPDPTSRTILKMWKRGKCKRMSRHS